MKLCKAVCSVKPLDGLSKKSLTASCGFKARLVIAVWAPMDQPVVDDFVVVVVVVGYELGIEIGGEKVR